MKTTSFVLSFIVLVCFSPLLSAQELGLLKSEKGYKITIDGEIFTEYITDQQGTPILWPIIGPGGKKMTRDFPMIPAGNPDEQKDHPHQRSFWFTHGDVNGEDFWALGKTKIRHDKFTFAESDGKITILITENTWLDSKGESLCTDVRSFRFFVQDGIRVVDFDIIITSAVEKCKFGDTKEGTFGIRVPGSMDVDAKKRNPEHGGTIINAQGLKNNEAWGKRSEWVDYSGPAGGEVSGITVMNHPESFRYPTYWHVRTYGLFAANPFGEHDYLRKKEKTGEFVLEKGDSIEFRYRILFHTGPVSSERLKNLFEIYAKTTK